MAIKYVAYYRVSTARQGRSGLGLDAQKHSVAEFLAGAGGHLVAEHVEVESGRKTERPELQAALASCRIRRATLLIARIDRLSRSAAFLLNLRDAGVEFLAADLPGANRLTVGILAMVAETEAEAISSRTKAALAAAARRGVKLGRTWRRNFGDAGRAKGRAAARHVINAKAAQRAADRGSHVRKLQAGGLTTPSELARGLNDLGVPASRGGQWSCLQVQRLLATLERAG
jgi:DNA invertase Pin-like site-specific DNA recombinase